MPGALQGIRARGILLFACAVVLTTPGSVANAAPGGPDGFHVLAASSRSGYAWYTAAILSEPGVETDRWIGNACLTGSGRRLVVVYGPRTFTNRPTCSSGAGSRPWSTCSPGR